MVTEQAEQAAAVVDLTNELAFAFGQEAATITCATLQEGTAAGDEAAPPNAGGSSVLGGDGARAGGTLVLRFLLSGMDRGRMDDTVAATMRQRGLGTSLSVSVLDSPEEVVNYLCPSARAEVGSGASSYTEKWSHWAKTAGAIERLWTGSRSIARVLNAAGSGSDRDLSLEAVGGRAGLRGLDYSEHCALFLDGIGALASAHYRPSISELLRLHSPSPLCPTRAALRLPRPVPRRREP